MRRPSRRARGPAGSGGAPPAGDLGERHRSGDPGDRLFGTAKGYNIEVAQSVTNNIRKEVSVVVDQNEITFYEQNTNQGTGAKSVCNFIGYRPM